MVKRRKSRSKYRWIRCATCGEHFKVRGRGRYRYCEKHRVSGYRPVPLWRQNLPTGRVGQIHVDLVKIDLLKRGHDVWESVDDHNKCDLVVSIDGRLRRVEVTTGHLTQHGTKIHHPKHQRKRYISPSWDVLAVVTEKGIIYESEHKLKEMIGNE